LGFRAVGRREQVEFARHCCERMEALVQAADPKSAAVTGIRTRL